MSERERQPEQPADETAAEARQKWFEMLCGVMLAVFASVLAVIDLGAGNAAEDQNIAANEAGSGYAWYQSKSIKQSLAEGQLGQLEVMLDSGLVVPESRAGLEPLKIELEAKIARYEKEKAEILAGSAAVGEANWAQDVNGEMGKIIGADEWKAKVGAMTEVNNVFDVATLFLQLCLVLGALSLLFQQALPRWMFFGVMNISGAIGTVYGVLAWLQYLKAA